MAPAWDIAPAHSTTSYGLSYMEKSKFKERYNIQTF